VRLSVHEFLTTDPKVTRERIREHFQTTGGFDLSPEQANAWGCEIELLRSVLSLMGTSQTATWTILFEYKLPRMNRWLDVVLLLPRTIIVIEFKVGCSSVLAADFAQTRDYVLDLKDFHHQSHGRQVVGLLCPTDLSPGTDDWEDGGTDLVTVVS